ncbi:tetratricopeptide repeat protein [Glaciimonas sp. CA11.2]|uniref:YfgM family protein n=1 Tax=unclassified Glaciimonas TaxID=2644401 RepID=UPI002AB4E9C5|nr:MULTISPECIES: tetratricopeptide repeat protein [unclassified Glaciimonas]MDY7547655.1 tetratricopeptide repeat protein [Glaciimonas sp. CA11.2]MEB0013025.1 tetratricopeptide repeat protein [Glaciimonas sp. Cout2]MEB0083592.1 tetratricopeptide repeat protein [Glaciimonas sp. Gout2]MEB0161539.1 tetratricopeptide repeat protein [Glaciimonas sp. CA11.2]
MAFNLEEQEQLATINDWWKKYGNLVTWVVIIALAGYAGWGGWKYYQNSQASQASQLYEEMQKAVGAKDNAKVQRAAADMQQKFSSTAYAEMAGMTAAKAAFDANDLNGAKAQLQWVIDHGRQEEYKTIAKIRLAGILLDQNAYDEGLKVLTGDVSPEFASALADRKGDILVAQNKLDEARVAYQLAIDKAVQGNPGRQLIQIKLDAIGGAPAKAAA